MADGFANLAGVAAPYVVTDADRAGWLAHSRPAQGQPIR